MPDQIRVLYLEESEMDKRELAYVKQTLFTVRDWDAFQAVIRTLAMLMKHTSPAAQVVKENNT